MEIEIEGLLITKLNSFHDWVSITCVVDDQNLVLTWNLHEERWAQNWAFHHLMRSERDDVLKQIPLRMDVINALFVKEGKSQVAFGKSVEASEPKVKPEVVGRCLAPESIDAVFNRTDTALGLTQVSKRICATGESPWKTTKAVREALKHIFTNGPVEICDYIYEMKSNDGRVESQGARPVETIITCTPKPKERDIFE